MADEQPTLDGSTEPMTEETDAEEAKESPEKERKELDDKILKDLKARVSASKRNRKQYFNEWKRNVELRIGKIASQFTGGVSVEDEVQTEFNPDWFLTKTKVANLFSQVPTVRMTHVQAQFAAAIGPFAKAVNYELSDKRMDFGSSMFEALNDVVNAAGIGGIFLGYSARFQDKTVPAVDVKGVPPEIVQQLMQSGQLPTTTVPEVVSDYFFGDRVSPTDLLWPAEFTGSNFNKSDWVGHTGRMPKAVAEKEFELSPEQLEKAESGVDIKDTDDLRSMPDKGGLTDVKGVRFDEIFYWRHRVDPEEKHFDAIWRIVWVDGIDKPVIHEPWKGQKLDPQRNKYIGTRRFPLQILTLAYVTDNPVPPSDSSIARPQVQDMRRSRSQMFQNRERSIPIRWFDVNRIDAQVQDSLMKGNWQGMIPVNGSGERAIGEVARATYPAEDLTFDQVAMNDLMTLWGLTPAQLGQAQGGRKTSQEVQAAGAGFSTNIGVERNRVASFFLSCVDVLCGLMAMYSDFPILSDQERQQMMQAWDTKHILHDLVLNVRPDSMVVLDSEQRLQRIMRALNMTGKSGYVNAMPLIAEFLELSGIDTTEQTPYGPVLMKPQPKTPDEPNISFRFTGKDDLMNPVVMAMLLKHNQGVSGEHLAAAKKLLLESQKPPEPEQPGPGAGGPPAPPPPGAGGPPREAEPGRDARPGWGLTNRIAKRSRDASGG